MITIDPHSQKPKYQQIYEQFRDQILDETYQAGTKLPPIRSLAAELEISRNTVETAYMHLCQEGYVTSRAGSGFVVEKPQPGETSASPQKEATQSTFIKRLNQTRLWQDKVIETDGDNLLPERVVKEFDYDFSYGDIQNGSFPAQTWRRLINEILCRTTNAKIGCYSDPLGEKELREHIAQMIRINSGVNCHPSQVVLQAGTQSALRNLLMIFDPLRDVVGMEDPGYDGVRTVFENARFRLFPLPMLEGTDTFIESLYNSHARLSFVTPSNQFPTGQVMPLPVRQRLLKWASTENAYILEDDYCREFRYTTRPLPSLQSLDRQNRVIYMGTFSKAISPALRISYLVLPPDLLFEWHKLFGNHYPEVPWLSQATLSVYFERGYWNKHLRKLYAQNKRKHTALLSAIDKHMGKRVDVLESGSGLHILVGVEDGRHQSELIRVAEEAKVKIYNTNRYWMSGYHGMENYVLVGFSAIPESRIEPGIAKLAKAWFG